MENKVKVNQVVRVPDGQRMKVRKIVISEKGKRHTFLVIDGQLVKESTMLPKAHLMSNPRDAEPGNKVMKTVRGILKEKRRVK